MFSPPVKRHAIQVGWAERQIHKTVLETRAGHGWGKEPNSTQFKQHNCCPCISASISIAEARQLRCREIPQVLFAARLANHLVDILSARARAASNHTDFFGGCCLFDLDIFPPNTIP